MKNIKFITALFCLLLVAQFNFAQADLDNGRLTNQAPQAVTEAEEPVVRDVARSGVYPTDFDNNSGEIDEVKEDSYYPIDAEIMQEEIMASAHPSVVAEKINTMNATIEDLRSMLEELRLENKVIRESLGNCCSNSELGLTARDAYLIQNTPNPITAATEISYFVPEGMEQVEIQITDFKGEILKSIEIKDTGYGKLKVDATGLNAGTFVYLLAIEGKVIDSKIMLVTK